MKLFKFKYFIPKHYIFRNTYVERKPGESANDRNDRAIRVACTWYQKHLDSSQNMRGDSEAVKIVLLTQDVKNRELAIREGLQAYGGILFLPFSYGPIHSNLFFSPFKLMIM